MPAMRHLLAILHHIALVVAILIGVEAWLSPAPVDWTQPVLRAGAPLLAAALA
jgi:hypothetical protein